MTIKARHYKSKKVFFGPWPTDEELCKELESKMPKSNEEEDKMIEALCPFPDITRKA